MRHLLIRIGIIAAWILLMTLYFVWASADPFAALGSAIIAVVMGGLVALCYLIFLFAEGFMLLNKGEMNLGVASLSLATLGAVVLYIVASQTIL